MTNVREAALQRLDLDAARLRTTHSRLIYCTTSGFGPGGPYHGRPAHDSVIQGASGMAGRFAAKGGEARYVPMVAGDHIVGEIVAGADPVEEPLVMGRHQLAVSRQQPARPEHEQRVVERPGAIRLPLVDADRADEAEAAADLAQLIHERAGHID